METTSSLSDEVQLMQELLKNLCNELNNNSFGTIFLKIWFDILKK